MMREIRGPAFERVLAYGLQKAQEIPGVDMNLTVYNHLRAWVSSFGVPRGRRESTHFVPIELVKEGDRIVAVIAMTSKLKKVEERSHVG